MYYHLLYHWKVPFKPMTPIQRKVDMPAYTSASSREVTNSTKTTKIVNTTNKLFQRKLVQVQ